MTIVWSKKLGGPAVQRVGVRQHLHVERRRSRQIQIPLTVRIILAVATDLYYAFLEGPDGA